MCLVYASYHLVQMYTKVLTAYRCVCNNKWLLPMSCAQIYTSRARAQNIHNNNNHSASTMKPTTSTNNFDHEVGVRGISISGSTRTKTNYVLWCFCMCVCVWVFGSATRQHTNTANTAIATTTYAVASRDVYRARSGSQHSSRVSSSSNGEFLGERALYEAHKK